MNKRRSSLFGAGHDKTPSIEIVGVDEEAERRGRVRIQKRVSLGHGHTHGATEGVVNSPSVGSAAAGVSNNSMAGYSAAQLAEHYANCMKLSAENKINVKNAFHLQLIDYMAEVMKTKKKSEMDNFQAASCALDASAKIYAYRVDSVHSDTLKLAGGVGKNSEDNKVKGGNDDDMDRNQGGDGDDDDDVKKKVRRKKKSATIEKNLNNINCAKFDLEFDVDPLFKKTSAQFDSGGGGGQFLCNLYMRDDGCQLLLDSEAYLPTCSNNTNTSDIGQEQDKLELALPKMEEAVLICPSFSTFVFRGWSPDNEDPAFLDLSLNSSQKTEEDGDDKHATAAAGDHAFDVNAPPVEDPEDSFLGGDGGGAFEDDPPDDQVFAEKHKAGLGMALMDVDKLRQHLSTVPNEYSYFDTGRLGAWAGPKHWKFKPLSRPGRDFVAPDVGGKSAKKLNKKDTAKEPYDFDDLYSSECLILDSIEKAMILPKKPIKLQNKTMVNWSEEKVLLPADLHYRGKDFATLFTAINFLVTDKGSGGVAEQQSVDDSINDYDFDNANDTNNFCPDVLESEGGVNSYPLDEEEEIAGPADDETLFPSQSQANLLVAAPNKVEKIQIAYAKQAKKMDMRRLKAVEWSILQSSTTENKENDEATANEASKDENNTTATVAEPISFSDLYRNLSDTKLLPSKMVDNLSVPLAFVALLHLCNERCLALESFPDFADFKILKA